MREVFAADWLALRELFDTRSRSRALAEQLIRMLPERPHLTDLGAGTGSLFRWLAPLIGRAQVWRFVDADADLLDRAFVACAAWGSAQGFAVTFPGSARHRAMLLHTRRGAWRIEAVCADLTITAALPPRADAVVCSALLDLVSRDWLERLGTALTGPLLACLSADGRDVFLPRHPLDHVVLAGFRHDQQTHKGFGPALGPRAASTLHTALAARGFTVASATSDWRIPRGATEMLGAIVRSHARVAARTVPARRTAIIAWARDRIAQAQAGRLAIRIGHRDSLVWPAQNDA